MNKIVLQLIVFQSFIGFAIGQTPTFSEEVATIFYSNCTKCHREGGIGPFKLESYQDAVNNALAIKQAVVSGYMPPWPPDTTYSRFAHERTLNNQQINKISQWVDAGMPQGNPVNAPDPPIFSTASELSQTPSVVHSIPTYTVTSNFDDYRAFVLPNPSAVDQAITELEFYPGNRRIVHHILLYYDTSGLCKQLDDADPLPGYSAFGGVGNANARQVGGWVPGSPALQLPLNFGIPAYANGHFVMQIHYAPGSAGQKDSTGFGVVYKAITPTMREVYQVPVLNHFTTLINGPLALAANQKKKFIESMTVPIPVSILGITPHMHLIGRDKKIWAKKPGVADTTKILRINDWNFNWQGQYMFRKMLVLPMGTMVRAESNYDNTSANPFNPSSPPQTVVAGESTLNEMMLTYFMFVSYLPGDENLVLDSNQITHKKEIVQTEMGWKLFPNPVQEEIFIVRQLIESGLTPAYLQIIDATGKSVLSTSLDQNNEHLGTSYRIDLRNLKPGFYKALILQKGKKAALSFVKVARI